MARAADLLPVGRAPAPAALVGIASIAAAFGVQRGTVDVWRHRGRAGVAFPEPDQFRGRRPLWRWGTVAAWAASVQAGDAGDGPALGRSS